MLQNNTRILCLFSVFRTRQYIIASIISLPSEIDIKNLQNFYPNINSLYFITNNDLEINFNSHHINLIKVNYLTISDFCKLLKNNQKNLKFNIFKEWINSSIFIFINISWHDVLMEFRSHDINVSGGNEKKRHILSPIQYKLSKICNLFFISNEFITDNYSNYKKFNLGIEAHHKEIEPSSKIIEPSKSFKTRFISKKEVYPVLKDKQSFFSFLRRKFIIKLVIFIEFFIKFLEYLLSKLKKYL